MNKKNQGWFPVFVTRSEDATRISFAEKPGAGCGETSPWHEFFFGRSSGPSRHTRDNPPGSKCKP